MHEKHTENIERDFARVSLLDCFIICIAVGVNFSYFMPFFISLACCLFVFFYDDIMKKTESGLGKALRYIAFCLGILFAVSIVAICALITTAAHKTPPKGAEAIIVLGGGLRGEDVSFSLARRLDKAIEYINENENTLVVVSGGQGRDEVIAEALAMKNYMLRNHVPEERIRMESRSSSTKENFLFSKKILDEEFPDKRYQVVFATSDFHVFRAGFYAKSIGLDAYGIAAKCEWFMLPNYYTREYVAIVYYVLMNAVAS